MSWTCTEKCYYLDWGALTDISIYSKLTTRQDKDTHVSSFLEDASNHLVKFNDPLSQSTPHIYMTFLPLMKEDSVVARHYATEFDGLARVECIGDKPNVACIKQINVDSRVYSVSFSPDGKRVASGSRRNVCVG